MSLQVEMLSRCKMVPSAHRLVVLSGEYSTKGHRILHAQPGRGCSLNTLCRYHPHREFLWEKVLRSWHFCPCLWTVQSCSDVDSMPLVSTCHLAWIDLCGDYSQTFTGNKVLAGTPVRSWSHRHLVDNIMGWIGKNLWFHQQSVVSLVLAWSMSWFFLMCF